MRQRLWPVSVAFLVLVGAACGQAPAPGLSVAVGPAAPQTIAWAQLSAGQPPVTVTVYEPYEQRDVTFSGIPAADALDRALGPAWRKSEVLQLIAQDGYTAAIPTQRLLTHKAWLAAARTDRPDFVLDKKVPKVETVAIAPFYLVWDSKNDPEIRAEGDYGWPYQLATVRTTTYHDAFPGLDPPEPVSPTVARGFALFAQHCATCHSLNGHGGKVGPELNAPHSVTEYWKPEWLRRWIDKPAEIRHNTAMPGLPAHVANRAQAVDDVIAYLTAMANKH